MKWFKHYSNALSSNALSILKANTGIAGYGRYWRLLEMMSVKFDGENDVEFAFDRRDLKEELGFHRDQDLFKFLSSLNQVGIMSHRTVDQAVVISSTILLELQSRDFKKARIERAETAPKIKDIRVKNKDLDKESDSTVMEKSTPAPTEAKFSSNTVDELLSTIPEQNRNGWLSIYDNDQEFIVREIRKAFVYYSNNPKKKPKSKRGWLTALSSWLERGWGYRAKNTAGKKTNTFKNEHLVGWANEPEEGA